VKEHIQISERDMEDPDIIIRIKTAMRWVNNYMQTSYTGIIPEQITDATAMYAAAKILDYLFTTDSPNESKLSMSLKRDAKYMLDLYAKDEADPESQVEKINSGFFDD